MKYIYLKTFYGKIEAIYLVDTKSKKAKCLFRIKSNFYKDPTVGECCTYGPTSAIANAINKKQFMSKKEAFMVAL